MLNLEFYKEEKKGEEVKLTMLNDKNFVSYFQALMSVFGGFPGDSLCNKTGFCTPADRKKSGVLSLGPSLPRTRWERLSKRFNFL